MYYYRIKGRYNLNFLFKSIYYSKYWKILLIFYFIGKRFLGIFLVECYIKNNVYLINKLNLVYMKKFLF